MRFCLIYLIFVFILVLPDQSRRSLGNIPTIAFSDTDSSMPYVDIGILLTTRGKNNIGCLFWMLARMVQTNARHHSPRAQVDLFFYREPEETKDQEVDEGAGPVPDFGVIEYGDSMLADDQWAGDVQRGGDAVPAPAIPYCWWGLN
ncbi:hypothetical protein MKW92_002882 [Papaver armeniacum]|nr:hypothetical protein MKW92_002882 [Papaver armeniacum]